MANGHGGARVGAGAKKKPLAEKLLMGKEDGNKIEHINFGDELSGVEMPEPKEYLSAKQRDGNNLQAKEIYEETWNWLNERKCAKLVNIMLIESYAMACARWLQCEDAVSNFGFLAKHPTTSQPIQSPFVSMSMNFRKQALNVWFQIFQIVKENCTTDFVDSDDPMERILSQALRK